MSSLAKKEGGDRKERGKSLSSLPCSSPVLRESRATGAEEEFPLQ